MLKYKMLIGVCLLSAGSAAYAEPAQVGIDVWPPFTLTNLDGIADKKAACIFKAAGIEASYKKFPWMRVYNMVMQGELQLSYGWVLNEKRESEVLFSQPMLQSNEYIVHLKDKEIVWNNIKDLGKYSIGGLIGYSHLDDFTREGIKPAAVVKSEQQLIEMLFAKRIDAFPISSQVLDEIKKGLPEEKKMQLQVNEKPFSESSMNFIATKNSLGTELIKKIDEALKSSSCN